jgi:Domain of unknown function (DUF5979)
VISIGFRRCAFVFVALVTLVTEAEVAIAQTPTTTMVRTLTVKLQVVGPRPATISGYTVTTTCRADATDTSGVVATQGFSSFGGSASQVFTLGATSACIVGVVPTGVGGSNAGVYLAIGGTVRASGTLGAGFAMTPSQYVSVTDNTAIDVVVSYPSFTVRTATVGAESVPGAEYLLALVCTYNDGVLYARTTFKLRSGTSRVFSTADFPELVVGSTCRVTELESNGAPAITIVAQPAEPTSLPINGESLPDGQIPGTNPFVDANFVPAIRPLFASGKFNPNGTTVTVTNKFVGDLMVSKVVAGSPRSNIAIYELQVLCNEGAVKDSFLLKHGQTWLRAGLLLGWSCVVSEVRSDGADVSFADNSGANATDGKVTIKATPTGCADPFLTVGPTWLSPTRTPSRPLRRMSRRESHRESHRVSRWCKPLASPVHRQLLTSRRRRLPQRRSRNPRCLIRPRKRWLERRKCAVRAGLDCVSSNRP